MNSTLATDCNNAAARLKGFLAEAPEPQLMRLCAESLQEMAENLHWYNSDITVATPFWEELCKTVRDMCMDTESHSGVMHDMAFELIECLALISRESTLKQKTRPALPAQTDVMRYFEGCGHWTPGDGTLVTEYYYSRIPEASTSH